jgi:16S rRNA (guanine527-N7)-methyltransferase
MQIPSEHDEKLRLLMRIFLAENANINLSALRTEEACWYGNIADSLAFMELNCAEKMNEPGATLLDIGTGGGFPLLPLAIVYPKTTCTGLDSIGKKILAITRIAKEAGIKMTAVADRAEVLGQKKKYREQYDFVTSRAVGPLNILLEYCAGFVKQGGYIVLWKSLHIDDELQASEVAQHDLRCPLVTTHAYTLPGDFGSRQLLVFRKNGPLNQKYPREVGMAKREPLGAPAKEVPEKL